ncbi:unnamed protein product [Laminaria digitata]
MKTKRRFTFRPDWCLLLSTADGYTRNRRSPKCHVRVVCRFIVGGRSQRWCRATGSTTFRSVRLARQRIPAAARCAWYVVGYTCFSWHVVGRVAFA